MSDVDLGWETLAPICITLWAWLMVALERLFPYDRGQRLFRRGFFVDFFWYTIFQSYLLGLVIKQIILGIDHAVGLTRLHLISHWPLWAQLGLFWITHDFYIYWFHRLQHHNRWLWRTHEAHHSVKDVDWLAGSRSHPLEILVNQTIEYAPIVLLGAHADIALMKGVLDACWGMWIHANVDARTGWLQYVINGPEMHRWHHSRDVADRNFGTKLAVWDWLFGTAYRPRRKPKGYGLIGEPDFPEGYFKQIIWAFRPMRRPAMRPSVDGPEMTTVESVTVANGSRGG